MAGHGKTIPGGKTVPTEGKTVPTIGKTAPRGKTAPPRGVGGPGGKTIPEKDRAPKRQRRLATVSNPGADDNEKGVVRGEGHDLEWKDERGEAVEWVPAVYHNEIREKLLVKTSNNGQLVYDHPRKHGFLPHDETAFLASQQHWGKNRSLWHLIPGDLLNRLDRLDHKGKDYETDYMVDEDSNRIILDMDNHPVINYEDIPLVLSSAFASSDEGWLMEAIQRIDRRIERGDFRARMPWERKSTANGKVEPLFTMSNIGNRGYRWRQNAAVVAWTQRSGSKNLRNYIVDLLSEEGRRNNTTRELIDGLTKEQKEEAKKPNKGKLLSKAGKRRLPKEVRERRETKSKQPTKRPNKNRTSTKRKAAENSEDGENGDIEDDDIKENHRSKRLKTETLEKAVGGDVSDPSTYVSSPRSPQDPRQLSFGIHGGGAGSRGSAEPQTDHSLALPASRATNTIQNLSEGPRYTRNPYTHAGFNPFHNPLGPVANDASLIGHIDPQIVFSKGMSLNNLASTVRHSHDSTGPTRPSHLPQKRNRDDDDTEGNLDLNAHQQKRYKADASSTRSKLWLGALTSIRLPTQVTPCISEHPHAMDESFPEPTDWPATYPTTPLLATNSSAPSSDSNNTSDSKRDCDVDGTRPITPSTTSAGLQPGRVDLADDYRFKQPQTPADAQNIFEALYLTRHNFTELFGRDIFGENGPETGYYDTYAKQYATLQKYSLALQLPSAEFVNLEHWGAWTGGFDKWKRTEITNEDFMPDLTVKGAGVETKAEFEVLAKAKVDSGIDDRELFRDFTTGIL